MLLGAITCTAFPFIGRMTDASTTSCGSPLAGTGIIAPLYTTDTVIEINGHLCLAIDTHAFFKDEAQALRTADLAQTTIRQEVEAARAGLQAAERVADGTLVSKTDLEKKRSDLVTKLARLEEAASKVAALSGERTIRLFINDMPSPVTTVVRIPPRDDLVDRWVWQRMQLRSHADAGSEDGKKWRAILANGKSMADQSVLLGIGGAEAKTPSAKLGRPVTLTGANNWMTLIGGAGLLVIALGLLLAFWDTGLLRDRVPSDGASMPPFSLGRAQMFWWLFLTFGGFLYVWLVSGQFNGVVTSDVLTLVGISGVSGLAARAIDVSSAPGNPDTAPRSRNFFYDILSDGSTIVLHRVQLFMWTIILGVIFVWSVLWNISFPVFDSNLLIMAGIVNGLYIGFKYPE